MAVRKGVSTDLHLFQHGPHHNELWTSHELLNDRRDGPSIATWIADYVWTEDTLAGSESGRLARVWVHRSVLL